MNLGADENENKPGEINSFIDSLSRDIVDENISKMLLQDVEQEAHRQELLPSSEIVPAEQLFGKAQNNRNRVMVNFNTGTRTHSTLKDYDRKKSKKELRKMLDNY